MYIIYLKKSMQKATKTSSSKNISIARAGEETIVLPYRKGLTVSEIFEEAGISLSSSEDIYVEAEEAAAEDILQAGDLIQIVGKKDGGSR